MNTVNKVLSSVRNMSAMLLVGAVGILVAACQPSHYATVQDQGAYSPSEFRYATANKDVRTIIRGNPFAVPEPAVEAVVLEAMQPVHWGFELAYTPRTHFTTEPDQSANLNYRIEVSFRPADVGAPSLICTGGNPDGVSAEPETVRARMAFCYREQLLSTTVGTLDGPRGLDDPRFAEMITRMTRDLFPHRDFRDGDDDRRSGLLSGTGILF
jgi:hypothetical protein